MGEGVTGSLVQSKIQSLKVVKSVSPIRLLTVSSPIGNDGFGGAGILGRNWGEEGVVTRQEETAFSTHVM